MANLSESNIWEPGIYQLETTDALMGGANGIDNFQAKQLANRTVYLKNLVGAGLPDILTVKSTTSQSLAAGVRTSLSFEHIIRDDANMLSPGVFSSFALPSGYRYASFKGGFVIAHTPGTANVVGCFISMTGGFPTVNTSGTDATSTATTLGASFSTAMMPISGGEIVSVDALSLLAASTVGAGSTSYFQIELHK